MYHSITFGDKNTYDDWHIIAEERPHVEPPEPVYIFDEVPGRNGSLDLTESLTGLVNYNDRTGSFDFIVENGFGNWIDRYSEIMRYLQGKRMKMTLEDDPDFYYIGRYYVSGWETGQNWSNITIDYQVEPFKYSHDEIVKTFSISGLSTTIRLRDIEQLTVPTIISTINTTATFDGRIHSIRMDREVADFGVWPDANGNVDITFTGTGSVTIKYRRVRL